jgi:four helix bundle protein
MDLVVEVYRVSKAFPQDERWGLTSQLQRAASSVPANIAEGQGRVHRGDFVHHLSVARGSLMELETHLQIANRLGYLRASEFDPLWARCQDVGRLLNGLIRSLTTGH